MLVKQRDPLRDAMAPRQFRRRATAIAAEMRRCAEFQESSGRRHMPLPSCKYVGVAAILAFVQRPTRQQARLGIIASALWRPRLLLLNPLNGSRREPTHVLARVRERRTKHRKRGLGHRANLAQRDAGAVS